MNIGFEELFHLQCQAGDRIASYFSTSPIVLPVPASQMSIQASSLFTDPMIGEIIHTGLCLCSYVSSLHKFLSSTCVPCFSSVYVGSSLHKFTHSTLPGLKYPLYMPCRNSAPCIYAQNCKVLIHIISKSQAEM